LGRQPDAFPAAVAVAGSVKRITGHDVNVFAGRFGAPLGSVMWSVRVDSHAELQEMTDKLAADPGYLEEIQSMNGLFMTPAEDRLARFVTEPVDAATSKYYALTRATMAAGHYSQAIDFGVRVANYIGGKLGTQTAFLKPTYGGFADVTWVTACDSMEAVDKLTDFQMSDSGYQKFVDEAGPLFVESSGVNSLIEKLN
jgi:hypothetical protein